MNIVQRFHDSIDTLVGLNIENRHSIPTNTRAGLSKVDWAKEFCTVRIDVGRRLGKTSYIISRATSGDIIITDKFHGARQRYENCQAVFDPYTFQKFDFHLFTFTHVFIDEPSLVYPKVSLDTIYNRLAKTGNETFIILGT